MKNHDGHQQGAQRHAEGQQGDKTHRAFLEGLQGSEESEGNARAANDPNARSGDVDAYGQPHPGKHRLQEDREQHDPAEKNSEAPKIDGLGG